MDCHQLSRLGPLGAAARERKCVRVVVDHHVGAERGDGDVVLADESAPATGVLVYDLIRRMGAPLPREAAEGVFVSIATDTGWFRYSNTDDHAFAVAADLVAGGVAPSLVYDAIHRRNAPESIGILAGGLAAAELESDGRIAVAALDRELVARAAAVGYDTDEVMEPLRSLERVEIVVLLKEKSDGRVKLSLRSRGRFDVDGVARSFGGGGHRKAAGAELAGPLPAAKEAVLSRVRDLIREAG
jgi:phosphoesterase RecJ-like protein